jgi:hypothetical protein
MTRDRQRREMLTESSQELVNQGMPTGPAQIYIGLMSDGSAWRLYRSPDGHRVDWLPGSYPTAREAIDAAKALQGTVTP